MTDSELKRRGYFLGTAPLVTQNSDAQINSSELSKAWNSGRASKVDGIASKGIQKYTASITESSDLYHSILHKLELDDLLAEEPYRSRLDAKFEALGSSFSEGNAQEIETVFFDGMQNHEVVAEDLWVKLSWLSFDEEDDSLRFRFSFGVDFEEDVASDRCRQRFSAELAEAIFQESEIITSNSSLINLIKDTINTESIEFVERIVYFNAPNGGAYLHHDRERGHAGVVYTQLTGSTYWLALPRNELVDEIQTYVSSCIKNPAAWPESVSADMRLELASLGKSKNELVRELEGFNNDSLIRLINETQEFVQRLIHQGYGIHLNPGDVILLPQSSDALCCWHSVFCIGDSPGEALSFAVR